ncbi:hypothetical protein [Rathayibacter iranicus]|uniref:Uncharacterized protein n=2 Tax=Rathayibacter iranicus TaxID=59737 RepID=A0AAD1AGH0_9MICO|nr:hypothetical protein [Rathayibacter iranicus]AZZ56124.1 hypothetical protein C7V51_09700 [Rathayibacter iranicus]MWV30180.1 hypothetical protein [Rathayibacter iranicus NCPPB 2253 = VKM Ac-1602]PPI46193.1 hypothetical protein C5E09_08700 [Rathayibacter iranicus]PPI59567.1 hypothetical protein C5E08_09620 [Rathayibacter iranicus]PPI71045.1 hypothetical protein C5E01_08665 [Rathayibacter iranicus]
MTEDAERIDPRYDPAFQRGFSGDVERLRVDERAFARPGTGAAVSPSATGSPEGTRFQRSTRVPSVERAALLHEPGNGAPAAPTPSEPPAEVPPGLADTPDVVREAPLLRNPWLLVLLFAGLAGTVLGLALLWTGYSSPPPPYYGDSDVPSPAWIQRQLLYYSCIPLLGCLPAALLLAVGVAALRWPGVPVQRRGEEGPQLLDAQARIVQTPKPQSPDAPNTRPSR